jgi:hypothetical protein
MTSTAFGVATALIGLLLVLRGYPMIRAVISLFGALVGFVLGAALTAQITHTGLFDTRVDLIGGAIGAVVFAVLAFLIYKVAMIGGLAAIGFTLGTSLMVALHVTTPGASLIAGILVALALAVIAWRLDLPALILVVLTVLTGASITTFGTLVALGRTSGNVMAPSQLATVVGEGWGWYVLYGALVVLGLVSQSRYLRVRTSTRTKWGKA